MRLDAHQHFWNYTAHAADYVWMTGKYGVLRRDFAPPDLAPLLQQSGFDGTIAVQARELPQETDYLLGLAARHPFIKGVVGWLDLTRPDIERDLARYSANPRLRGLRLLIHDQPDVDFANSPAHRRGVGRLRQYSLTYDLLVRPPHLRASTALVDALPDQPFVVDHIAKPLIAQRIFSPWREDLAELARRPNVTCKLSGLVTEADWTAWKPADLVPYLDIVLELFGPHRLMIGSDWPVCTCAADYERTMRVVIDWAARLSPVERDAVLGGTCARFYGIHS
ncbi:MAG: amidohydrolase family protein [Opitutaceae bacterium]